MDDPVSHINFVYKSCINRRWPLPTIAIILVGQQVSPIGYEACPLTDRTASLQDTARYGSRASCNRNLWMVTFGFYNGWLPLGSWLTWFGCKCDFEINQKYNQVTVVGIYSILLRNTTKLPWLILTWWKSQYHPRGWLGDLPWNGAMWEFPKIGDPNIVP